MAVECTDQAEFVRAVNLGRGRQSQGQREAAHVILAAPSVSGKPQCKCGMDSRFHLEQGMGGMVALGDFQALLALCQET